MGGEEDKLARAEKIRQTIRALEEALSICNQYLNRLEAEERSSENFPEHMFFKTEQVSR